MIKIAFVFHQYMWLYNTGIKSGMFDWKLAGIVFARFQHTRHHPHATSLSKVQQPYVTLALFLQICITVPSRWITIQVALPFLI